MNYLVTLLLFALLSASATAQQGRVRLIHPEPRNLVAVSVSRVNDVHASFAGSQWVTGTVYGRWPGGALSKQFKDLDVIFVPDSATAAALPHLNITHETGTNRHTVTVVDLLNGLEALRMAVSPDQYRRLLERRVNHVRATGRFLIESYVVGVECDAPWARARLVGAELPEQLAVRHIAIPETC
jgi:hypothetical protein